MSGLSAQSLSVGQQIDAAAASNASVDSSGTVTFDTRNGGQVRMASTPAWGNLVSASAGSATLDLITLGNFSPAGLNFAGTATGGGAVDPALYPVNTGTATAAGPVTLAQGFVTPFGSAPPAFSAQAVTTGDRLSAAAARRRVAERGRRDALLEPKRRGSRGRSRQPRPHQYARDRHRPDRHRPGVPAGEPADHDDRCQRAGPHARDRQLDLPSPPACRSTNSAAAFSTALGTTLNGTNKIYRLVAVGQYNSATNTFVAHDIDVALQGVSPARVRGRQRCPGNVERSGRAHSRRRSTSRTCASSPAAACRTSSFEYVEGGAEDEAHAAREPQRLHALAARAAHADRHLRDVTSAGCSSAAHGRAAHHRAHRLQRHAVRGRRRGARARGGDARHPLHAQHLLHRRRLEDVARARRRASVAAAVRHEGSRHRARAHPAGGGGRLRGTRLHDRCQRLRQPRMGPAQLPRPGKPTPA